MNQARDGTEADRGWWQATKDWLREKGAERPSTLSTLTSYFREGIKTWHDVLSRPLPDSNVQPPEMGTLFNPTPQILTNEIQAGHAGRDYESVLDAYAARGGDGREHKEREIER
jgi:hypothetical protein